MRSFAPCFELSNSSLTGEGGHDVPGCTCFVSLLKFVAELAARRRIEGEPGRRLWLLAAEPLGVEDIFGLVVLFNWGRPPDVDGREILDKLKDCC